MKAIRACVLAEYGESYGGPKALNYEAIALFESLREHTDIEGYADYNIGNCYGHLGDKLQAIWHYKKALSAGPPDDLTAQILTNLGGIYDSLEDIKKAIAAHKKALKLVPSHWESLAGLASIEAARGRYSKAAEYLHHCLSIHPDLEQKGIAQLSVFARCLFELGEYKSAYVRINQALSIDPRDEYSRNIKMHILGELWKKNPEFIEVAINYFNNEILNGFQPDAARDELFALYIENGDRQKAKSVLEKLLKDGEPSYGRYFNYARILKEEGNIIGAIDHLQLAFKIRSTHHAAHVLGDWLYKTERYEEAAYYYKASLVGLKNQSQVLNNVAYCYHHLGNHLESLRYSAKAILCSPRENAFWRNLIASYLHTNKRAFMNDLEDLIDQIVHGRGRIKPALEALLYILQKEFGEEFTQSIASCDLNESDAI